ncbi:endonuclease domain-containing protein [bacterium]|nr:MAG: endonuclease domain-containing protein [bacterium]
MLRQSKVEFSRELRRRQTDCEQRIWGRLRDRRLAGFKFRRQRPIGPYIVDFCCLEKRLVVELDGGQHSERREYDERRTRFLEDEGFRVLRFWDNEVLDETEGVLETIYRNLLDPHPDPLPQAGEGEKTRNPHPDPLPQAGEGDSGGEKTDD